MTIALRVLGGLIALGLIAVAAFLLPPHLQVRAIDHPFPTAEELSAVRAADGPIAIHHVVTSQQDTLDGTLGHLSIVAEYADGRLFVIDAGMDHDAARAFGDTVRALGVSQSDAVVLGTLTERMGAASARIAGIGFTHLHIDHTQGVVDLCAHAGLEEAVRVQTVEQATEHNFNTTQGAAILEGSCLSPVQLPGARLAPAAGFPGIAAMTLGGHTPGSTLWVIALETGTYVFSGDITNSWAEVAEDRGKGLLYSYLFVPEATRRTAAIRDWLRRLDAEANLSVVVSHDLARTEALIPAFES